MAECSWAPGLPWSVSSMLGITHWRKPTFLAPEATKCQWLALCLCLSCRRPFMLFIDKYGWIFFFSFLLHHSYFMSGHVVHFWCMLYVCKEYGDVSVLLTHIKLCWLVVLLWCIYLISVNCLTSENAQCLPLFLVWLLRIWVYIFCSCYLLTDT